MSVASASSPSSLSIFLPIAGSSDAISLPLPKDGKVRLKLDEGEGGTHEAEVNIQDLLAQELVQPEIWLGVALAYLRDSDTATFESLLREFCGDDAQSFYVDSRFKSGRIAVFNALAAYETRRASVARSERESEAAFNSATELYNRSADIDANVDSTWVGKGILFIVRGQLKEAADAFGSALLSDRDKDNALARLGMAIVHMRRKEYNEGLKALRGALEANPQLPAECRLGFALCYYYLGNLRSCRASLDRVLALSTNGENENENVHALLGLATLEMETWREKAQAIENIARQQHQAPNKSSKVNISTRLKELEGEGHMQRAFDFLQRAYSIDPTNPQALLLLSTHHFYSADIAKSRHFAQKAKHQLDARPQIATEETKATILYHLARTRHVAGEYEAAYNLYQEAKQLQPTNPLICLGYAQMLLAWSGETEKAIENLELILTPTTQSNANHSHSSSNTNSHSHSHSTTTQSTDVKSTTTVQNNFDVLRLLGSLYSLPPSKSAQYAAAAAAASKDRSHRTPQLVPLPDYDRSYTYLKHAVELQPNALDLLLEFAEVAARVRKYSESYLSYRRALRLMRDVHKMSAESINADMLNNMGVVCHKLGKQEESREYYQWSLKNRKLQHQQQHDMETEEKSAAISTPESADEVSTHYNLALLDDAAGFTTQAFTRLQHIAEREPVYSDAWLLQGVMHQRNGDLAKAKELFLRAQKALEDAVKGSSEMNGQAASSSKTSESPLSTSLALTHLLLGNVALAQNEVDAATHSFDTVLTTLGAKANKRDDYAKLSVGNIILQKAHRKVRAIAAANPQMAPLLASPAMAAHAALPQPIQEKLKAAQKDYKTAGDYYSSVLFRTPRNLYAAHGLACVLAEQGKVTEAKDLFQQVKDITHSGKKEVDADDIEMPDVWCNMGHAYVAQGSYLSAARMYEYCLRIVRPGSTGRGLSRVQLLTFLARAHYLGDDTVAAKRATMKALHLHPNSAPLLYNLAIIGEAYAITVFQKPPNTRSYREVESALVELHAAFTIFQRLAAPGAVQLSKADQALYGDIGDKAGKHALFCRHSIDNGQPHLAYARAREEEAERVLEESRAVRIKLEQEAEEKRRLEDERRRKQQEELEAAAEAKKKYLEQIAQTWETVTTEEKKSRGAGAGAVGTGADEEGMGGGEGGVDAEIAQRRARSKAGRKRVKRERDSESEGEGYEEGERKRKKKKEKKGRSKYQLAEESDGDKEASYTARPPIKREEEEEEGEAELEIAARKAKAGHMVDIIQQQQGEVKTERKSRLTKLSTASDDDDDEVALPDTAAAAANDEEEAQQQVSSKKRRRRIEEDEDEEDVAMAPPQAEPVNADADAQPAADAAMTD